MDRLDELAIRATHPLVLCSSAEKEQTCEAAMG